MKSACFAIVALTLIAGAAPAAPEQTMPDIALPAPRTAGGPSLKAALKARQSGRAFDRKPLPLQVVSDLLWAACGVNRSNTGRRTAPSAHNWQEIDVYVILPSGAYIYDAKTNALRAVARGDLREKTGSQDFVATAPLNLVYAADLSRMKGASPEDVALYSGTDTGFISQNVYLFCAAEGLATVVRGGVSRDALAQALNLPPTLRIMLAQTVGYPAGEKP